MSCGYLMIVRLSKRHASAPEFQRVLTEFGCSIKMRLGLHETDETYCSEDGLILLQLCGEAEKLGELEGAINNLPGARAKLVDLSAI